MSDDYDLNCHCRAETGELLCFVECACTCHDHYPDPSDIDICPAGGPHTPTNDSSHPDRMTDPYWHCDECGASLPPPEREP